MKTNLKSENIHNQKGGEKRMKYSRIIMTFGVVVSVLFAIAFIANTSTAEDVRLSKHNLTTNIVQATGTTEVCVFCHTPHGGATVAEGAAPLWNRNLTSDADKLTYKMYTSPNFDGTGMNAGPDTGKPKGVSIACLSCHDGTVAFDSLLNFPGSGSPSNTDPGNVNNIILPTGVTDFDSIAGTTPYPNLGVDLSNDHPISMEIPCATDPQFSGICTNLGFGSPGGIDLGTKVAFLVRDTTKQPASPLYSDARNKLRAYPSVAGKAYIECASCHNPHIGTAESSRFLRLASYDPGGPSSPFSTTDRNAGSLICLSCHEK